MKKLLLLLTLTIATVANAAIGDWTIHMAYSEPQQIERVGEQLFVRASNSLYLYNKADQSIQTFNKSTGLNDVTITNIAWNSTAQRLVITYDNSNIDLLDMQGNVTNVPDLYNKIMVGDKTINSITNSGKYAYIATNFGGVKLNVEMAEISESYLLGFGARIIQEGNADIYLRALDWKVYKCHKDDNAQDKANWQVTTSWPDVSLVVDNSAWDENIDIVRTLKPDGPKYNFFGFLKMHDNKLYTCNGGLWDKKNPAAIQILDIENSEWTTYNNDGVAEKYGINYQDILTLDIDKSDSRHIMAGSQSGLFEFYDGQIVEHYNHKNSSISFVPGLEGNPDYEIISSVLFNGQGELLVANSHTKKPISILDRNKKMTTLDESDNIEHSENLKFMGFGSDNKLWAYSDYWEHPAIYSYDFDRNKITEYSNFVNQDGIAITNVYRCQCISEDNKGNIWVGLDQGLFVITPEYKDNPEMGFYQIKVPRDDGTNLADYLLSGTDITAIAIDNANRKWIGTNGNGVYLISADNMVEEKHFTTSNSLLLSDIIQSIAIDNTTGIVYVGTEKGLCSYQSDATPTNEEMNKDNVWAYPNPVTPEYEGMITVVGLSLDADVKITTANGSLVAEGRSSGGSFQWNGKDSRGNHVASGVYMVITAKSDGTKGTVCKISIVN